MRTIVKDAVGIRVYPVTGGMEEHKGAVYYDDRYEPTVYCNDKSFDPDIVEYIKETAACADTQTAGGVQTPNH